MKIINKPIEVVVVTDKEGVITPKKFRITAEDESDVTVVIDGVIKRDTYRVEKKQIRSFTCRCAINGVQKIVELKYFNEETSWILYRIM